MIDRSQERRGVLVRTCLMIWVLVTCSLFENSFINHLWFLHFFVKMLYVDKICHNLQIFILKKLLWALAGCLSWLERHPTFQNVAGLIPGHGAYGRWPSMFLSHSLSLSLWIINKNMSSGEDFLKIMKLKSLILKGKIILGLKYIGTEFWYIFSNVLPISLRNPGATALKNHLENITSEYSGNKIFFHILKLGRNM